MSLLRRDFNAKRIEEVANHPDVRPLVAPGSDYLELDKLVNDPRNVALMCDAGGVLFVAKLPGFYEVHIQFLPSAWGTFAIEATRESVRWMFSHTDATELWAQVPSENVRVLGMVRAMHARKECEAKGAKCYVLTYQDWAQRDASAAEAGSWFSDLLDVKCLKAGLAEPKAEPAWQRAFGATILALRSGQLDKGLLLFNRWSLLSGYAPISLLSRWPTTLALGGLVVAFSEEDFELISQEGGAQCQ